jgi:hypothetical protein
MNDQRPVLTLKNAWFRTYCGNVEALLEWLALALVGAVAGYRYGDGNAASDRQDQRPFKESNT